MIDELQKQKVLHQTFVKFQGLCDFKRFFFQDSKQISFLCLKYFQGFKILEIAEIYMKVFHCRWHFEFFLLFPMANYKDN